MNTKQKVITIAAIVVGLAVAGAMFFLYPDMMYKGTGLQDQTGSPAGTSLSLLGVGSSSKAISSNAS
jgi:hypothetical protein